MRLAQFNFPNGSEFPDFVPNAEPLIPVSPCLFDDFLHSGIDLCLVQLLGCRCIAPRLGRVTNPKGKPAYEQGKRQREDDDTGQASLLAAAIRAPSNLSHPIRSRADTSIR